MRDLGSRIRDRTGIPSVGRGILNYWTTRKVCPIFFFQNLVVFNSFLDFCHMYQNREYISVPDLKSSISLRSSDSFEWKRVQREYNLGAKGESLFLNWHSFQDFYMYKTQKCLFLLKNDFIGVFHNQNWTSQGLFFNVYLIFIPLFTYDNNIYISCLFSLSCKFQERYQCYY